MDAYNIRRKEEKAIMEIEKNAMDKLME